MKTLLFKARLWRYAAALSLSFFSHFLHAQFVSFDPIVSTFAGTGAKGLVNGAGNVAQFRVVSAIKLDSKGNAFVVDASNNCVRKITPAGVVSTFGNTTTLKNPYGLAIDKDDNLYVTELNNRCIRKITPAGVMSLHAGVVASAAYVDGVKGTAKFYSPTNITIDNQGNLYVIDLKMVNTTLQHYIRKVTPTGTVSTFLGGTAGYQDGKGSSVKFRDPGGMIVDSLDNLYLVDGGNHKIRKIRLEDTVVTTVAGSTHGYQDGTLTTAKFYSPQEIALDKIGNIYVTDYTNQLVRKISGNYVTTLAGTPTINGFVNGAGTLSMFDYPIGIVSDSVGNLLVCDVTNNVIRKISAQKTAPFTTTSGSASAVQTLYVSGDNLDASFMVVQAPTGYEVSLSETTGFTSQVALTGTDGAIVTTKVFIRLSANNAPGIRNGDVTLTASASSVLKTTALQVTGTVSGPTGLEKEGSSTARIYPNPAADELFIETSSDWNATEYQLFTAEGKLHHSAQLSISSKTQSLDISSLKEGMYVLKLSNGKQHAFTTFVKR